MVSSDLLLIFNVRNLSLYLFIFGKLCIKMQVDVAVFIYDLWKYLLAIIITTP